MQPYINPNYFTQYQQPINPYMQRLDNMQQNYSMQPTQMQGTTQMQPIGRVVENVDTVKTIEIPYQGVYYFPTADGKAIYTKQWLENGQTRILTFKPLLDDNSNNLPQDDKQGQFDTFNEVLRGIQDDIKALTDKIEKISKPTRAKKESADDE